MSIALMTLAFKTSLPTTQKFVLVALADSANDQGECYPSVSVLMEKCSLSDRGVQRALSQLEADGHLRRELRKGRSTVYWITPTPDTWSPQPRPNVTPERWSPPNVGRDTPDTRSPPPPNVGRDTPDTRSPITVTETSVEPSGNRKTKTAKPDPTVADLVEAGFDPDTAAEFIATKAQRKAPLTARAWVDHLREADAAGWTPQAAAEKVMAKTWKGFEAKYVEREAPSARGSPPESFRERDIREAEAKVAFLTGRKPFTPQADFIDVEAHDVTPRRLG